jgi:uncharacterized protein YbaP (TraB family)
MRSTIATYLSPRLLLVACVLLFAGVNEGIAGQALIYRVYAGDAPRAFVIGTMHTEDPRVSGLLEQFDPLIEQTEVVAIEMVPDAVTLMAVAASTLLPGEQSLRLLIGNRRFESLAAAAEPRGG